MAFAILMGIVQVIIQIHNTDSLTKNREALIPVGKRLGLEDTSNPSLRNKIDRWFYRLAFIVVIAAGTVLTCIILLSKN